MRPDRIRVLPPAVLAGLTLAACDGGPAPSAFVVQDSAGVEIVTTPAATLADAPAWSLDGEPLLDLGTVDDGGPTEFYRVRDVRFLPGDRIVVANQGSEELRFFSLDGEHLHSAGQRGNGPREFSGLAMVRARADSLVTFDGGNDRFSVRGPWGEYVRSFRLDWFSGLLSPEDILNGSRILTITGRHMAELEGTGIVVDTALISVYDMEGHGAPERAFAADADLTGGAGNGGGRACWLDAGAGAPQPRDGSRRQPHG